MLTVYSSPDIIESSLHILGFMDRGERSIFETQQPILNGNISYPGY